MHSGWQITPSCMCSILKYLINDWEQHYLVLHICNRRSLYALVVDTELVDSRLYKIFKLQNLIEINIEYLQWMNNLKFIKHWAKRKEKISKFLLNIISICPLIQIILHNSIGNCLCGYTSKSKVNIHDTIVDTK